MADKFNLFGQKQTISKSQESSAINRGSANPNLNISTVRKLRRLGGGGGGGSSTSIQEDNSEAQKRAELERQKQSALTDLRSQLLTARSQITDSFRKSIRQQRGIGGRLQLEKQRNQLLSQLNSQFNNRRESISQGNIPERDVRSLSLSQAQKIGDELVNKLRTGGGFTIENPLTGQRTFISSEQARSNPEGILHGFERDLNTAINLNQGKPLSLEEIRNSKVVERIPTTKEKFEFRVQQLKKEPVFRNFGLAEGIAGVDVGFEKFSQFLSSKINQADVNKVFGSKIGEALTKPRDISAGEILLFSFFNPFLQSGASQQTEQVVKVIKNAKYFRDALKKLSKEEQNSQIKKAVDKIKISSFSNAKKEELLIKLKALLLEARTNQRFILNDGSVDLLALQRFENKLLSKVSKSSAIAKPTTAELSIKIPVTPKIKGAGSGLSSLTQLGIENPSIVQVGGKGTSSFTGQGAKFEKDNLVSFSFKKTGIVPRELQRKIINQTINQRRSELQSSGLSSSQINKQLNKEKQELISKMNQQSKLGQNSRTGLKSLSGQKNAQRTLQNQQQQQRQEQRQRQQQIQKSSLRTSQQTAQRSSQRFRNNLRDRFGRPQPRRFGRRGPRRFGIPLFDGSGKRKRIKTSITRKIPKFDVFTYKRGKVKRISSKPFTSKKSALDFGAFQTSKTLRASFFVKPSKRKTVQNIPPSIRGFFGRSSSQFRPSKNPRRTNVFVEKRKFRLNSPSELREIKISRRKKSKGFF